MCLFCRVFHHQSILNLILKSYRIGTCTLGTSPLQSSLPIFASSFYKNEGLWCRFFDREDFVLLQLQEQAERISEEDLRSNKQQSDLEQLIENQNRILQNSIEYNAKSY